MLGGVADAEDMVQETFLRWRKQEAIEIASAKAWLISTIMRLRRATTKPVSCYFQRET